MATTSTFGSRVQGSTAAHENLFQKIDVLERYLEGIHSDLFKLDEQARGVKEEKDNVEAYLDERAQKTKTRLMGELNAFEREVRNHIENSRKETAKIDEKINALKEGQLATLQLVLSLQRRVREIQVQLGVADEQ